MGTNRQLAQHDPMILRIMGASAAVLLLSAAWFVFTTIHWPLVGDAALMHYITFLMDHGRVPYRDIADMNLPGAYLPDWLVIHTLGTSALAWRTYDLLLLTLAGLAMYRIMRPISWIAALWAAVLFAVIHGRDGLDQTGQRDLTLAVLLLIGIATLLAQRPTRMPWHSFTFGLCTGAGALIKPTAIPFLLLATPILWERHRSKAPLWPPIAAILSGWLLPVCITLVWLHHQGALSAFLHIQKTFTPFHASLGRRPLVELLKHSLSPVIPIVALWLLLLASRRWRQRPPGPSLPEQVIQRQTLLLGAALGLITYILQGKDFPYHRYPLLAFLLPLVALDLDTMLLARNPLRWISALILLASSLFIGGTSALVASLYDWRNQEFRTTLETDLARIQVEIGVSSLAGRVQCIDSVYGCISTLYDLQLLQSTGFLYDEFLFHPAGVPAIDESRNQFWQAIEANPPAVFVVTEPLFPTGPYHYQKLSQWPGFTHWLNDRYILDVDRPAMHSVRLGGAAFHPPGYRIYVEASLLRSAPKIPSR